MSENFIHINNIVEDRGGGFGMKDIKKARRCGNTDELRDVEHHEDISYYPRESASCQGGGW